MESKALRLICGMLLCALAAVTFAQAPKEVPVAEEPRHHFTFENDVIRAFRVEVAPHDRTLLHRHDRDYFYIAIGAADIVNAVLGRPEVSAHMADMQVGFAKGGFAHVAENRGDAPFRNFTIEFKRPQTQLTNRCARIDPAQPVNCPTLGEDSTSSVPELETEQVVVALLRVLPGAKLVLEDSHLPRLLMPIGEISGYVLAGSGKKTKLQTGKELWLKGESNLTVANNSKTSAHLLSIAIKENSKK